MISAPETVTRCTSRGRRAQEAILAAPGADQFAGAAREA
jgi:hypothetical protein